MTFKSFVDLYTADMKTRLKENIWATKDTEVVLPRFIPYQTENSITISTLSKNTSDNTKNQYNQSL